MGGWMGGWVDGWVDGWVAGLAGNIAISAQLKLELGLSLAKGKEKKAAANKKRSDFYKTEEGQAVKRYYAEKASKKHELIRLLKEYKTGGKNEAELTKETIARLIENFL